MQNFKEAFGAKIKQLRKMRGLTQEELSEMVDINPRQLSRIEKGENFASAETIARFSIYLDVPLTDLFDFEWNKEVTLLATGTDAAPVIRLVQKDETVSVQSSRDKANNLDVPKHFKANVAESIMMNTAKKLKKPITVEYFNEKQRKYIKTFHPNGEVEINISEKNIHADEIQNYIKDKMKNYSAEMEKLEFIKLAVDSLSNPNALHELKILIKGIELAQKNTR